jgi:hypothetical protein
MDRATLSVILGKISIYILYIFNYQISRNYLLIHYIFIDLSKIDRYQTDVTQISVQSANSYVSIFPFGDICIPYYNTCIITKILMSSDFTLEKHC